MQKIMFHNGLGFFIRIKLIFISILFIFYYPIPSISSPIKRLKNCIPTGFVYSNDNIKFNHNIIGKNQAHLYLIYNRSNKTIILIHPLAEDPGASAGWDSEINKQRWSAILLNRPNFIFSCQTESKGRFNKVSCAKVLKICRLRRVKLQDPELEDSSFWVAENLPLEDLLSQIQKRKILISYGS